MCSRFVNRGQVIFCVDNVCHVDYSGVMSLDKKEHNDEVTSLVSRIR